VIDFLLALVPSAGVLFLFVIAIRALVHADRRERAAAAQIHDREAGSPETDQRN
jgi:hypothetical protein